MSSSLKETRGQARTVFSLSDCSDRESSAGPREVWLPHIRETWPRLAELPALTLLPRPRPPRPQVSIAAAHALGPVLPLADLLMLPSLDGVTLPGPQARFPPRPRHSQKETSSEGCQRLSQPFLACWDHFTGRVSGAMGRLF